MPEAHDPLAQALTEVRDEVAGYVRPPGSAAAIATVHMRRRARVLTLGVLAVALVLGPIALLQPGRGTPAPGGSTNTGPAAVWHDFVACARAHGHPEWPDPVVNADGTATFPNFEYKQAYEAVKGACGPILDRLPPGARPTGQQTH